MVAPSPTMRATWVAVNGASTSSWRNRLMAVNRSGSELIRVPSRSKIRNCGCGSANKSATLPENRCADAYQGRPFCDRHLKITTHPHGQLLHAHPGDLLALNHCGKFPQ